MSSGKGLRMKCAQVSFFCVLQLQVTFCEIMFNYRLCTGVEVTVDLMWI